MLLTLGNLLWFLVAWIDLAFMTSIVWLLSWLPKKLTKSFFFPIYNYWCRIFVRATGVKLKLHQKNIKPLPKQYILIGNHPSLFEDAGMPALFEAKFLAKIEVASWWIVGRISTYAGNLYVKRECKESRKQASIDLLKTLENGHNIALYPEGGCKGRRIFLPFRHGIFDISLKSEVPIVPVFLHYESQDDFEWHKQHLLVKLKMIMTSQNPTANYYVYDAINPSNFSSKEELCQHVQNLYLKWQQRYLD